MKALRQFQSFVKAAGAWLVKALLAQRADYKPPPPPGAVRAQDLPRARANNGQVVLVKPMNRADCRAVARFERRTFGVTFTRAFFLASAAYPSPVKTVRRLGPGK